MNKKYVLTYSNGDFLDIDQASGYPFRRKGDSPHIWNNIGEATKYADMFPSENLEVWEMLYTLKEEGVTEEIEVFVDLTDFMHEIGAGNAAGPHYIYNSLEEIKRKQPCVEQCGIVRAKLIKLEIVQGSDYTKKTDHELSYFQKYKLMEKALESIATFTHKETCDNRNEMVPVYECGCYENSQWDIAKEVLEKIKKD